MATLTHEEARISPLPIPPCTPPVPLRLPCFSFHQGALSALAKRPDSQLRLDYNATPWSAGAKDGAGTVYSGLFAS